MKHVLKRLGIACTMILSSSTFTLGKVTKIPFFEGSFQELQMMAQQQNKPILAYFYKNACRECRSLEEELWTNPEVIRLIENHYLAFKKNVYTSEGRKLINEFKVLNAPALLVLNGNGELQQIIERPGNGKELYDALDRYKMASSVSNTPYPRSMGMFSASVLPQKYQSLNSEAKRSSDADINPQKAVEQVQLSAKDEIHDSHQLPLVSELQTTHRRAVKGMEALSPWIEASANSEKTSFSIIFGRYHRIGRLKKELKNIQKFWRNGLWVMEEMDPYTEKWTYVLMVGNFKDDEKADYFARYFGQAGDPRKEVIALESLTKVRP